METKFNFKSAVCTSRSQSERLLALGLKPETADMAWLRGHEKPVVLSNTFNDKEYGCIPAWSLHRLWELGKFIGIHLSSEATISNLYEYAIVRIEKQIKEGDFNKEYLV